MKLYIQIFSFLIMLAPLSIVIGGDGISANYSYVLLMLLIAGFKLYYNRDASLYIAYIFISGFVGFLVNALLLGLGPELLFRQLISLILAFFPCIFLFVDAKKYYSQFKTSVVIASLVYSIFVMLVLMKMLASGVVNPFELKDLMSEIVPDWPQRYVIVLFAGLFFSLPGSEGNKSLFSYFIFLVILLAIISTFLRAAYIALFFGFFIMFFVGPKFMKKTIVDKTFFFIRALLISLFALFVLYFISQQSGLSESISLIFEYTLESVVRLSSGGANENVSDQTRVDIFSLVLSSLSINPLTGLGGAGVYVLDPQFGSAHNQYVDFLVRFGILGLAFFVYFNIRIVKHYLSLDSRVVGLMGCFAVFALAHETTKYSYGGAIFFFLLSTTYKKASSSLTGR